MVGVHAWCPDWEGQIYDIEIYFWSEELGTESVYFEYFKAPLVVCEDYYFYVWEYPAYPEIVVIHFSNEEGDNIGFVFSEPEIIMK